MPSQQSRLFYSKRIIPATTRLYLPRFAKVLQVLKGHKADTILDIGCGDGVFTRILKERTDATTAYGIDLSVQGIEIAKKNGIRARIHDVDEGLPFKDNTFDLIFCGSMIEIVADPDLMLAQIRRVLKPSGICILTFPNMTGWLSRVAVLLGYPPYYYRLSTRYDFGKLFGRRVDDATNGMIRLYTPRTLRELAGLYGLTVTGMFGAREIAIPFPLNLIDHAMQYIPPLSFQVVAVMRKS